MRKIPAALARPDARSTYTTYDMMKKSLSVIVLVGVLSACSGDGAPALTVETRALESPAGEGSGEPFLSSTGDAVYLSWLEPSAVGGHELRFARSNGEAWSDGGVIAHSEHFFVNWADFPSVTADSDGTLWAHWLEQGPKGGYDYGVRVVWSPDEGRHWSEPWTPHDDGTPTEHGFVSALPMAGGMGFIWLDGRNTASGPEGSPHNGGRIAEMQYMQRAYPGASW